MGNRIDDLEVGVSLNDRDLIEGLQASERRVDRFAAKVRRTKPSLELSLEKFKIGVREVNAIMKDLSRKEATIAIKADTRGLLRAYGEARLLTARIGAMKSVVRITGNVSPLATKFAESIGMKKSFDKAMSRTPADFFRQVSKMRVSMGLFSSTVGQAATTLTLFGPIVQGVVGSLVALGGAAGSAAAGGIAVLGAGLSGMILTLGGVAAAIQPTIAGFSSATKAATAYSDAVRKHGQGSDQAKKKLKELNSVMAHVPASSRNAIRTWGQVRSQFRAMTREMSEKQVGRVATAAAGAASRLMPAFAAQTNRATETLGNAGTSAAKAIQAPRISGEIDTLMSGFNQSLQPVLKGLGQLGDLMLRVFAAATPQLVRLSTAFGEWATHINEANSDAGVLGQTIDRQGGRLSNIISLLGSAGNLLKTVFAGGAQEGDNLVVSLTNVFNKWNAILQTPAGQRGLQNWFKDATDTARKLGPAIVGVVTNLATFTEAVKPISDAMLGFVAAIGKGLHALEQFRIGSVGIGQAVVQGLAIALILQRVGLIGPAFVAAKFISVNAMRGIIVAWRLVQLAFAASPFGAVLLALAAVAAALVIAYKKSQTFRDIVNGAFAAVKSFIVGAIDAILGGFSSLLGGIASVAGALGKDGLAKAARAGQTGIDNLRESLRQVPKETEAKVKVTVELDGQTVDVSGAKPLSANPPSGDGFGIKKKVRSVARGAASAYAKKHPEKFQDQLGSAGLPGGSAGGLHGADPRLGGIAKIAARFGLGVSSGRDDHSLTTSSGNVSFHSTGEALDFSNGTNTPEENAFQKFMHDKFGGRIAELIGPNVGLNLKNGSPYPYDAGIQAQHKNHVHVAWDLGAPGLGIGGGGDASGRSVLGQAGNRKGDGEGLGGNAKRIWQRLRAMGLTPAQAAGVMGNIQHESGYRTNAIENNGRGEGHGLVQWSFKRRRALMAFAAKRRQPWTNIDVQLDFLQQEMRGPYAGAVRALKGTHTVADAAMVWQRQFERPRVTQDRSGAARAAFNAFRNVGGGSGGGPTKAEAQDAKRKLQSRIDKLDDQLRALREKKLTLPTGKKGLAPRAAINRQISKLSGQRVTLSRRRRDVGPGRDPATIPTLGSQQNDPAGLIVTNDRAVVEAAADTPQLQDDITSNLDLSTHIMDTVKTDRDRLAKIQKALKGRLTQQTRDRLLGEQDTIQQRMPTALKEVRDLRRTRDELGIQRQFGGGRGQAGLDFMAAQAESTVSLNDDMAVMNQQMALWKALLVQRTKRGDLAGMTEAQQQINTINNNLKQINDQQRADYINQGLDAADEAVQFAQTTTSVFDDVSSLEAQAAAVWWAIQRAYGVLDAGRAGQLTQQLTGITQSLAKARQTAEEAPLTARLALARLTDDTSDDTSALQAILGVHEARLAAAQAVNDYVTIAEEAGTVKSLRDELNQSQGNLFEQTRLLSAARGDLYRQYGSNERSLSPVGEVPGGKTVVVNNYYKNMPLDSHTWSRDVLFELTAAG